MRITIDIDEKILDDIQKITAIPKKSPAIQRALENYIRTIHKKKIIDKAYKRTKGLLENKRSQLEAVANELLEKEIIFQSDLEKLIGKRPFKTHSTYEEFTKRVEEKEKIAREKAKKEDEKIKLNNDEALANSESGNNTGEMKKNGQLDKSKTSDSIEKTNPVDEGMTGS